MTGEIAGFIGILLVVVILFFTEKTSADVAALFGLLLLILFGYLTPHEAFSGFSSTAVLTVIPMFIIGAGLRYTGLADLFSSRIYSIIGDREIYNVAAVILIGACVATVMNKVAATALLLPTVVGISHRSHIPASRLLIPLTFGIMLGGSTTLLGTASNIVASQVLLSHGYAAYSFFSFAPYGFPMLIAGGLFMIFIGRHLLPKLKSSADDEDINLSEVYRLHERVFSLRVPYGSSLHNQSLSTLHFGESLDAGVLSMIRQGERILAPGAQQKIQAGDILLVRGRQEELQNLLRFKSAQTRDFEERILANEIIKKSLTVKDSDVGKTLKDLSLPKRFGVVVAAILRSDGLVFKDLAYKKLRSGDVLFLLGSKQSLEALAKDYELKDLDSLLNPSVRNKGSLFVMRLPEDSRLSGVSIKESRIGELAGATVLAQQRDQGRAYLNDSSALLKPGDNLVIAGDRERIEALANLGDLEMLSIDGGLAAIEDDDVGLMEVVLAPRSQLISKTLTEVGFREKYDMNVLAIWRDARPQRARFSRTPLRFGDALLLHGPRQKMPFFSKDPDFVVLGEDREIDWRSNKAGFALLSIILLIFVSAGGFQPSEVAAWIAVVALVLSGAISMEEGYREVDWRLVILISAFIPLGLVAQKLGLTPLISNFIAGHFAAQGPLVVLIVLGLMASFISQILDSSLAVILLAPIAINLAQVMSFNVHVAVMTVAIATNIAFLTPYSHRSHLLVMGVGGYKVKDYFKPGFWMTLISFLVLFVGIYLAI